MISHFFIHPTILHTLKSGYKKIFHFNIIVLFIFLSNNTYATPQLSNSSTVDLKNKLETFFGAKKLKKVAGNSIHSTKAIKLFYKYNEYNPAWTGGKTPIKVARNFLTCVYESASHGLNPLYYHVPAISKIINGNKPTESQLLDLELLMTDAYLTLGSHYLRGKVDPTKFNSSWRTYKREFDMAAYFLDALKGKDICYSLELLLPIHPEYQDLRYALSVYKNLRWKALPLAKEYNFVLQKGDKHAIIKEVRKRLQVTGELKKGKITDKFDAELASAIMAFQRNHGMHYDGILRPQTLVKLNVTAEHHVQQIIANLERWRWQPDEFQERHIQINIAAFTLQLLEKGIQTYESNVIVGRHTNPTPSFTDSITHMIFNPYWNLPKSIVRNELIPEVKIDPFYLMNNDIAVIKDGEQLNPFQIDFDKINPNKYYFRQGTNAFNPMGAVKFMFPNSFSVYLHDTPYKDLFNNSRRTNSHGCIRLQNPIEFAEFLLKEQKGWTRKKIDKILFSQQEKVISLRRPIPINILYFTVFTDSDGVIQFREDIYNWDEEVYRALNDLPIKKNKKKAKPDKEQ